MKGIIFGLLLICFAWADGTAYKTVRIGNQVWMAQNLNEKTAEGSWCYRNVKENCEKYGRLYTWTAAMNLPSDCNKKKCTEKIKNPHQGICPKGFQVPTQDEYLQLYDFVGGMEIAGEKLKTRNEWRSLLSKNKGVDAYGFSALPAGYLSSGRFYYIDEASYFWTSRQKSDEDNDNAEYALAYSLGSDRQNAFALYYAKRVGMSLRCVEDSPDK